MITVRYKRDELLLQSAGCVFFAIICGVLFFQFDVLQFRLISGGLALTLPVMAVILAAKTRGDLTAIAADRSGLRVSTMWSSTAIPWARVTSIGRVALQESTAGLFKKTIAWYLVVTEYDGGFERRHKINEKLLDWPQDAIDALIGQIAALDDPGIASVPPGTAGPRPGFGRRMV
jgi:hypothetical protein